MIPAELFGDNVPAAGAPPAFALVHHSQGLDAIAAMERALAEGGPFFVAWMPPGIDSRETARRSTTR